ncbi:MAG: hypothetical protein HY569_00345 [Candidatus Magasanikbacteria bacterium]|nr:hypothetical protein [Candidatus Magasanikbacteria bacterium]
MPEKTINHSAFYWILEIRHLSFIMYLLFDLSTKDTIHLAVFDKNAIEHKNYSGRNRELLSCIHNLSKIKNLSGIMVVVGAGGFTSTRVACVVANTFAYVLKIPLLAITAAEASDPQKLIPKLLKQKSGNYISAAYSGEANIGRKKV